MTVPAVSCALQGVAIQVVRARSLFAGRRLGGVWEQTV